MSGGCLEGIYTVSGKCLESVKIVFFQSNIIFRCLKGKRV